MKRRDELKAGIVTGGTKKRASLVRKSETTDKVKDSLGKLNVLEQGQIDVVQQKLACMPVIVTRNSRSSSSVCA